MPSLAACRLAEALPPAPGDLPVALAVVEPASQVLLGLGDADTAARGAAEALLGPLPGPNGRSGDDPAVIWQSPDRFLVVSEGRADLPAMLRRGLAGRVAAVTDVTDGLAAIAVAGPGAIRLLGQGCSHDMAALRPGAAATTLFATLRATLYPVSPEDWRIHVERASAAWFWSWLCTAATAQAATESSGS